MRGRRRAPRLGRRRTNWAATLVALLAVVLFATGMAMRYGHMLDDMPDARPIGALPPPGPADTLSGRFARCGGPVRDTCVVDGDTFWFEGEKYRIADINTPEISSPQCDRELALGERATDRLAQLLNAGPFSFGRIEEDIDRYGRKLRTVRRGGISLGDVMVDEGLAERWQGFRGNWC